MSSRERTRLTEHVNKFAHSWSELFRISESTGIPAGTACEIKQSTSAFTAIAQYAMSAPGMTAAQEVSYACNLVPTGMHLPYQVLVIPSLQSRSGRSVNRYVARAVAESVPDETGVNESDAKSRSFVRANRI